jgi:hypothetical protein
MDRFTICVLLYGSDEHGWLHQRCLESLINVLPREAAEIRIGLNDVTSEVSVGLISRLITTFDSVRIFGGPNIGKYPRMREMLEDANREFVMWFDDDSFLKPELGSSSGLSPVWAWLDEIALSLHRRPGVLGARYRQRWAAGRQDWLKQHPKYRGVPLDPNYEQFITGGWWVAPLSVLRTLDWPGEALYHNGGDRLLGSLALQNGFELVPFRRGVAINADRLGRESRAPRRGINTRGLGDG